MEPAWTQTACLPTSVSCVPPPILTCPFALSLHSSATVSDPQHHHHHRQRQAPPPPPPPPPYPALRAHLDRRHQRDRLAMATATVLAPSAHYPPPSYSSAYPQHSVVGAGAVSMISSESRRSSDDAELSNRQSLPSISEVISGTRPGQYPPPTPSSMQPGSGLPSPFTQTTHQYPESDKHASPQPLHAASSFPQRQEALPAFVDSPRPPFNGRHSLPPVSDRRPTPPTKSEMSPQHPQKPSGSRSPNGAYAHPPPPPPPPPTSHPYQPGQIPPGQIPLPSYPISPRHAVPIAPGHYDPRAQPVHPEEADYSNRARYDGSLNRHFETWSYQDSLSRIGSSSRTVFNFAEAYTRIAREQHGSQPIPERLPTEREVSEMLANVDLIKRSLEQVKDAVQASIQSERAREGTKVKGAYDEDHDVSMYGDGMKPQYSMQHEVKKRRGRAAPPGRCHSCNRIDTPEWRRGPDGARTLCNACGLHYAKLERKRQLEARSIRPKPEDRA
ncbi:Uncharacterized protein TCAP_01900 [Tolypocladium capitatum]|uniref:GATA-type domain-containing protein n=1 Tax=Tolypocladium capitatum TaxID=45235 RepID=A0A2K3QKW1_9HYPO|nr:Uncharacterized protein TCAP_01900 [Tolypocladium capitatum]